MGEKNKARLWLPSSARASAEAPKYRCRVCGSVTSSDGEYVRHAARHARYDREQIQADSPRVKHPGIQGDDGVDTEFIDWWAPKIANGEMP